MNSETPEPLRRIVEWNERRKARERMFWRVVFFGFALLFITVSIAAAVR